MFVFFFLLSFRWKSHFYKGKYRQHMDTHSEFFSCLLKLTLVFSARVIDKPEQRISLENFKNFLLESQKVLFWLLDIYIFYRWFVLFYAQIHFFFHSRKCGPQISKSRSLCSATWKTPWGKWNSLISTKMRYAHLAVPHTFFPPFSHLFSCSFLSLFTVMEKHNMFS